jgi:hypothetical protein
VGDLRFPQQQVKNVIFWHLASQSGIKLAQFGEIHYSHFRVDKAGSSEFLQNASKFLPYSKDLQIRRHYYPITKQLSNKFYFNNYSLVVCEYLDSAKCTGLNYIGDPSPHIFVCDESNISRCIIPVGTQKITNATKMDISVSADLLTT